MSKKQKPTITFADGRWTVGSYSTSVPGKLINHLRKKHQVEMSVNDVLALATTAPDAPVETAVPAAPKPDAETKES